MAPTPRAMNMKAFGCERWLLACALTLSAIAAHAVGIDCSKAKTRVEHLICDDVAVAQLDIDLSITYQSAVDKAVDPAVVVRSQRDWLKQRNVCTDTACLAQAYRSRIEALNQVKPAGWKTYHDAKLGISFDYLENRQIKACQGRTEERCVALVGRDMAGSDYLIAFKRVDGRLEEVASREAGFKQNDGGK